MSAVILKVTFKNREEMIKWSILKKQMMIHQKAFANSQATGQKPVKH